MAEIIRASDFLKKVCEAVNVDFDTVRRVVLDITYDKYVTVYIEQLGTEKLLEINMSSDGIQLSKVAVVKKVGEDG